jgi:hypothetical protein
MVTKSGKKLLGRHGHRLEDNIKTDLKKMGVCGMDSTGSGYVLVTDLCT